MESVVRDDDGYLLELTPEQEDAIEESIAEIERGEGISGEEMLAQLRTMQSPDVRQNTVLGNLWLTRLLAMAREREVVGVP